MSGYGNYAAGGYNDLSMRPNYQSSYTHNSWNHLQPQQGQYRQQQYNRMEQKPDAQHQQQAMKQTMPVTMGQQAPDSVSPLTASAGVKSSVNVHHQGMSAASGMIMGQREANHVGHKQPYPQPTSYDRSSQAVPSHRNQGQGLAGRMDNFGMGGGSAGYGHSGLQFDGQNHSADNGLASKGNVNQHQQNNQQQQMRGTGDFLGGPSAKNLSSIHPSNPGAQGGDSTPYSAVSSMTQTNMNNMHADHQGLSNDSKEQHYSQPPPQPNPVATSPSHIDESRRVASEVATAFVREFYRTLKFNPENLRMFYSTKAQMSCQVCQFTEDNSGTEWKSYYGQNDDEVSEIFAKILPLCVPAELVAEQISESPFVSLSKVITLESQPMSDGAIFLQASGIILDRYGSERSFTHSVILKVDAGSRNYSIAHDMLIFGEPTISASQMQKINAAKQAATAPPAQTERSNANDNAVRSCVEPTFVTEAPSTETVPSGIEAEHPAPEIPSPGAKLTDCQPTSASVTQSESTCSQTTETVVTKTSPWKTLPPQAPAAASGIRTEDNAAKASASMAASQVSSPAQAVEQSGPQRQNFPNYGATTYAGKLISSAGGSASELVTAKVTTQVVRRSNGNRPRAEDQAPMSEKDLKMSKSLHVAHLPPEFTDEDIKRAIAEQLKGGPVEGRVVNIQRMAKGPAGFIELDSQACAEVLLSKPYGFCVRGKNVRIEKAKNVYTPANRGRTDRPARQVGDDNTQPRSSTGQGQRDQDQHRNNEGRENYRANYYNRNENDSNPNSYRRPYNRGRGGASRGGGNNQPVRTNN